MIASLPPAKKLYLSAYACDPSVGSESGAGWASLVAASKLVDKIVLLTRSENTTALLNAVKDLDAEIEVHAIETNFDSKGSTYRRYFSWLIKASRSMKQLTTEPGIVQHVTFASDSFPIPILFGFSSPQRVVWGPVGGSTYPAFRLSLRIGLVFAIRELFRKAIHSILRTFTHFTLVRKLNFFVGLNEDSKKHGPRNVESLIHPNCILDYQELPTRTLHNQKTIVYAGRLLPLKGLKLLISAFKLLPPDWNLRIIGDGPLEADLRKTCEIYGERVEFTGRLDREATLENIAECSVFALPSLHDSFGWAAAEAAGIGLPVVCLELGGVAQAAGHNAVVVSSTPVATIEQRLARAIISTNDRRFIKQEDWTLESMVRAFRTSYGLKSLTDSPDDSLIDKKNSKKEVTE